MIFSNVEVHDSSVEIEILLAEDVLLVVAERLDIFGLILKLFISWIIHLKCLLDLFSSLHASIPTTIDIILYPLSSQCTHFFNFDPLHIWNDLLMLPNGTNWGMDVRLDIVAGVQKLGINHNGLLKVRLIKPLLSLRRVRIPHDVILWCLSCLDRLLQSRETLPIHICDLILWTPLDNCIKVFQRLI